MSWLDARVVCVCVCVRLCVWLLITLAPLLITLNTGLLSNLALFLGVVFFFALGINRDTSYVSLSISGIQFIYSIPL